MQWNVASNIPRLRGDLRCDTVIVGSGIAGLSAAYELAQAGQKVIVIDRGAIAGGMTARTTAHLAPICDDGLSSLVSIRGEEMAELFQRSHEAAVTQIETIIERHKIACEFRRLDAFLFPAVHMEAAEGRKQRDKEYDAARQAGAEAEKVKGVPLKGFEDSPVLRYPKQATFHPLKYLSGLVDAIREAGGQIFENSPFTQLDESGDQVRLTVADLGTIAAARAIFATNSPVNDRVALHSKMAPYRTYAMAFTIPRNALPDALYWDMADPYHYVRLSPGQGTADYLIAGGGDHKSGEVDDGSARFEAIEAWIRSLVPDLGKEAHRWSGQVLDTVDYCAFIGRNPGSDHVYVASGDSGQGMTHGALAGILLRDLITNGSSEWEEVYDPARRTPKSLLNYLRENITAIKNLTQHALPGEISSVGELRPGDGGLIRDGRSVIAACRDMDGKLHTHSAACTHLGCTVHWNSTEQCWDCPCHGSHFAPDGAVLNAPAISPLATATVGAEKKEKAKA
jgi:glycine/D-amino acid oxidase-like deaminating enzyme/nitrite reductase/ring-hydroxylating ferredoxin subunit